jgi:hypothetical protein
LILKKISNVIAALAIVIGVYYGNFTVQKPPATSSLSRPPSSSTEHVVWQETYAWGQLHENGGAIMYQ